MTKDIFMGGRSFVVTDIEKEKALAPKLKGFHAPLTSMRAVQWLAGEERRIPGSYLGWDESPKTALIMACALSTIYDNETGWRLRREYANSTSPKALDYVYNVMGYGKGSSTAVNKKRKWVELGNSPEGGPEGDGFKFRGGGFIQITGRYNYNRDVLPVIERLIRDGNKKGLTEGAIKVLNSPEVRKTIASRDMVHMTSSQVTTIMNDWTVACLTTREFYDGHPLMTGFAAKFKAYLNKITHMSEAETYIIRTMMRVIGSYRKQAWYSPQGHRTPSLSEMTTRAASLYNTLSALDIPLYEESTK